MDQITGALVGIALVLSAVFVPMAFFGGSTGVIYRQFSITIVSADGALGAGRAGPHAGAVRHDAEAASRRARSTSSAASSAGSTAASTRQRDATQAAVRHASLRHSAPALIVTPACVVAIVVVLFMRLPTAFLPDEDQGILFAMVQLPPGATQERTHERARAGGEPLPRRRTGCASRASSASRASASAAPGRTRASRSSSSRTGRSANGPHQTVKAIAGRAMGAFTQIKDALAFAFAPPACSSSATSTASTCGSRTTPALGHEALMAARNQFLGMACAESRARAACGRTAWTTRRSSSSTSTRRRPARSGSRSPTSMPTLSQHLGRCVRQ